MQQKAYSRFNLCNPIHFLAVGFGSGLIHPAPGTWGSLVGILLGVWLLPLLGLKIFLILTALGFALGCYLCKKTSEDMGVHDHGSIVWDEIIGVLLVLAAVPEISWLWCSVAFVLFRLFDILKPFPIRFFDRRLTSGFGIMIDDILAACYAVLCITIMRCFF